ncbi:MAG: pyruvate formate lyase-activating protein [Ruminococcaceae bacterium]|nr:pyruvate formate lyase-activating protein [Oscillospiraceae bacterium]
MNGYINSVQSFGAVDGPGVRYVIFMQGCPLRCSCCHNPDTWEFSKEQEVTPEEMLTKILRFREYFGHDGGVTVSGGEALMQCEFVRKLFTLCKKENIHTCLDTSGCILDEKVKKLLSVTDLVLLDIKYTNEKDYKGYVGCSLSDVLKFYDYLEENNIPTWVRQVIIPTKNDTEENISKLLEITDNHKNCTEKIELLPFRKLCQPKYDNLNMEFPFSNIPEASPERVKELQEIIKNHAN